MSAKSLFLLTDQTIDILSYRERLQNRSAGAIVTFDGRIRDHNEGHHVTALAYQAYPELALRTGNQIIAEEIAKHGVLSAFAIHRTGEIAIGESAVWVGVSSEHRHAAFSAAQTIMERLKYELPIWKKETYLSGSSEWVGPDATAANTGLPSADLPVWKAELTEIWISPGNDFRGRHGMQRGENGSISLTEVECIPGMGLIGDRYFGYKPDFKGQVTFFDADVVRAVKEHFGLASVGNELFRRNIIVRGIRLGDWIGKRFLFQGIEFEGSEECKPCYWMDEAVTPGTEEFLKQNCRGGLRARIRSHGILKKNG